MYSLSPSGVLTGNGRPPAFSAAVTSSSVIAEATQVTERWEARPISAVTRPPVPRLTSPPSWKVTGPRLETRTRGVSSAIRGEPYPLVRPGPARGADTVGAHP